MPTAFTSHSAANYHQRPVSVFTLHNDDILTVTAGALRDFAQDHHRVLLARGGSSDNEVAEPSDQVVDCLGVLDMSRMSSSDRQRDATAHSARRSLSDFQPNEFVTLPRATLEKMATWYAHEGFHLWTVRNSARTNVDFDWLGSQPDFDAHEPEIPLCACDEYDKNGVRLPEYEFYEEDGMTGVMTNGVIADA